MSNIRSKDCVNAIIEECRNPLVVIRAYCGPGNYEDPVVLANACRQVYLGRVALGHDGDTTIEDITRLCTNPRNWKRHTKETSRDGSILRGFDCTPFDDQLRAYVRETNGVIVDVSIEGE